MTTSTRTYTTLRDSITTLWEAHLRWTKFSAQTSLPGADFFRASWWDVDLSMVSLSQDQIDSTFGDASVILPQDLTRPAHWPEWTLPAHAPSGRPTFDSELARWRSNPDTYAPPP